MDSRIHDENYENVCGGCLKYGSQSMVPLIDNNHLSIYGAMLSKISGVLIESQDKMPHRICFNCQKLLQQTLDFSDQYIRTYKTLRTIIENSGNSYKENIIMCSLFQDDDFTFPDYAKTIDESDSENSDQETDDEHLSDGSDVAKDLPNPRSKQKRKVESIEADQILEEMEDYIKTVRCNETERVKVVKNTKKTLKKEVNKIGEKYMCDICKKFYSSKTVLLTHLKRHKEPEFICELCARKFVTGQELALHQGFTHHIGRTHKCSHCDYVAVRRSIVRVHERVHTGERPYACGVCARAFTRRQVLRKHALLHADRTVQCPDCPRRFYNRGEMRAHHNSRHARRFVYGCELCAARYSRGHCLRRHLARAHHVRRDQQTALKRLYLPPPAPPPAPAPAPQ